MPADPVFVQHIDIFLFYPCRSSDPPDARCVIEKNARLTGRRIRSIMACHKHGEGVIRRPPGSRDALWDELQAALQEYRAACGPAPAAWGRSWRTCPARISAAAGLRSDARRSCRCSSWPLRACSCRCRAAPSCSAKASTGTGTACPGMPAARGCRLQTRVHGGAARLPGTPSAAAAAACVRCPLPAAASALQGYRHTLAVAPPPHPKKGSPD